MVKRILKKVASKRVELDVKREELKVKGEELKEELKVVAKENISKHLSLFQKLDKFLYEPTLLKVPIVLVLTFLIGLLLNNLGASITAPLIFTLLKIILLFFISTYLVFFVIHLIRRSLKKLMNAKSMWTLFAAYALFIFSIMLLFSSIYDISERSNSGYLKYGQCTDQFTPEGIHNDTTESHNYFYFSATTLLTVGYGDICPMGINRYIAIINAFVGNFINVVLMVWVISNYMKRKDEDVENGKENGKENENESVNETTRRKKS